MERQHGEIRTKDTSGYSTKDARSMPSQSDLIDLLNAAAAQLAGKGEKIVGPTFGELASSWLEVEGKRLVAPQNERRHLEHLRTIWPLRESELTPRVAREALFALLKPAGPLGQATVNKVRSTAARVIRTAQESEEWRGNNPFQILRRLREKKPEWGSFTVQECKRFLRRLAPHRQREAATMLYLGPRPGEIIGLRKEDVDLDRGLITWRRSHERNQTKTGKSRRVPIPDELVPVLKEAMDESRGDLVFPGPDGVSMQSRDSKLTNRLRTALWRAGILDGWRLVCCRKGCGHSEEFREQPTFDLVCPYCEQKLRPHPIPRKMRWYDLRHSAATLHREAGCDPLVIKLALGHASRSVTDDIYTHLSDDYMRMNLNKFSLLANTTTLAPGTDE